MTYDLAWFLETRLRLRRTPEGRALVDRGLSLLARLEAADTADAAVLRAEIDAIAAQLVQRFGARRPDILH